MQNVDVIDIDSRSHLEVADRKHRYAKNLRLYIKEFYNLHGGKDILESFEIKHKWSKYDLFFDWLDNSEVLPNVCKLLLYLSINYC